MRFSELSEQTIFTFFQDDRYVTCCKVSDRQAFCFDDLKLVTVHHNRDCKESAGMTETLQHKVGRDGQQYLCQPIAQGRWYARRIILLTGGTMSEQQFTTPETPHQTGEEATRLDRLNFVIEMLMEKLHETETVVEMVKMVLKPGLSERDSYNKIMSSLMTKNVGVLSE